MQSFKATIEKMNPCASLSLSEAVKVIENVFVEFPLTVMLLGKLKEAEPI